MRACLSLVSTLVMSACSAQSTPAMVESSPSEATTTALDQGALAWLGDTSLGHDGWAIAAGAVMSKRPLDVYTQTWPIGAASSVTLFWKVDGAVASQEASIDAHGAGREGHNTRWRATIPASVLEDGRPVEYWLRATDGGGGVLWDSNGGQNHRLTPHDEIVLFDGSTTAGWRMSGRGSFALEDGALVGHPGEGLGLYWSTYPVPPSFELSLEFRLSRHDDNSGVVLRFPDPDARGYDNAAWVGVHYGLEVQIDEIARPDGADVHRTGAIYEQPNQLLTPRPARAPGEWSTYVIVVTDQTYSVRLDGQEVTRLAWSGDPAEPRRALPGGPGDPRFIGLQTHTGEVAFRNVRLRAPSAR